MTADLGDRRPGRERCPTCGYDLTGLASLKCPECGRPLYRFTDRAREVAVLANAHALNLLRNGDPDQRRPSWWCIVQAVPHAVLPFHFLLGLVTGPPGIGLHAVRACGVDPDELRRAVVQRCPRFAPVHIAPDTRLPLSASSSELLSAAVDEAARLGQPWVGTEHILLALCLEKDRVARGALSAMGVTRAKIEGAVMSNVAALGGVDAASRRPDRPTQGHGL